MLLYNFLGICLATPRSKDTNRHIFLKPELTKDIPTGVPQHAEQEKRSAAEPDELHQALSAMHSLIRLKTRLPIPLLNNNTHTHSDNPMPQ